MQSKRKSMVEALTSTAIGFGVLMSLTLYVLPAWGLHPTISDAWGITALYTAVSMIRCYLVRRWFDSA